MTYASLLLSLAAAGWSLFLYRRLRDTEARLDNARNSHFRLADQTRSQLDALEGEVRQLQRQLRAGQGGPRFAADMTVGEAVALEPRAAEVLAGFHIGGCDGCAVDPADTLRHAAQRGGQDEAQLLTALNRLDGGNVSEVEQMLERRPNVQFDL